ncbi:MAG: ROK family transcriptional regulator [Thermoactinospora sp.]|nr:ROK family transcriptional regulator [Thermoactinospora sp.]
MKPSRHDSMRASNLALVLGEIHRRGPLTRAALSELTGLTKTTCSKLVGDLIEAGLAVESGAQRDGERGRPGVEVRLSGDRVAALGLEVNVDYLAVCVVDLTGQVRQRRQVHVDNRGSRPGSTLADLRDLAEAAVAESGLSIAGAALAVPGPVHDGVLQHAPHLGWHDVHVDLGMPLTVDNEANLAALGELWFGSGARDFLYVSGEIGIGAGLVVDGALFRGAYGFAGELGHVVVFPDGPGCRCGARGCLEVYAGQEALQGASSMEQAGEALGLALASAVHLVDPGRIILGGVFAPLFPQLKEPMGRVLSARLGGMRTPPSLGVSELGSDAAILGAAGHVIRQVVTDPAPYTSTRSAPA